MTSTQPHLLSLRPQPYTGKQTLLLNAVEGDPKVPAILEVSVEATAAAATTEMAENLGTECMLIPQLGSQHREAVVSHLIVRSTLLKHTPMTSNVVNVGPYSRPVPLPLKAQPSSP